MKRTLVVCALAGALSIKPAFAIFGIGDIVFDPSNYAQAIEQLLELQRQYSQLVRTYEMVRNQYEHMVRMAQKVPVDMAQRYRAVATPWRTSSATDTYGATSGWGGGHQYRCKRGERLPAGGPETDLIRLALSHSRRPTRPRPDKLRDGGTRRWREHPRHRDHWATPRKRYRRGDGPSKGSKRIRCPPPRV